MFYYFEITKRQDFVVVLNSYSGDSDVYVTVAGDPDSYEWKSDTELESDQINIRANDEYFVVGTYMIRIVGYSSSSYSIEAHEEGSHVKLVDGWPYVFSLNREAIFRSSGEAEGNLIYCQLVPLSEMHSPEVYVSFEPLSKDQSLKPGPEHFDYFYGPEDYDSLYRRLNFHLQKSSEKGAFMLGVYSNSTAADIEIRCSSSYEISIVKLNTHRKESIPRGGSYTRFQVRLD